MGWGDKFVNVVRGVNPKESGVDVFLGVAETDARMLQQLGVRAYFRYIAQTVTGAGWGDRIRP